MSSIPIIVVVDINIEELVALAIDMPEIVLDAGIDTEPVKLVINISMANNSRNWNEDDVFAGLRCSSAKQYGGEPSQPYSDSWLALARMPFLFATASKADRITLVTGVTHEKLHVFHQWIAYASFVLALTYTFPYIVWHVRNHDMANQVTVSNIFEYCIGIVALVFQVSSILGPGIRFGEQPGRSDAI
ncbi:uncharacterized protein Z519_09803 [Cladophialophora bantiana CBS 173.52]|uniref:Ferric oxidoreductase domain-containing protein n=1 Tax=Cladophialophora bantiana (strain ATCC 10958 / CBS 173.52 / CDC B-1940 / NIH 8579) TaxID=1442370 RepID=A0A0D2FSW2_CLAB1|nr:uncharacterized protein Z519_09803 [Cladophialophora bantiana CBS 173.52]KIW89647.1 hypothetical protein Z519_09803 [Cladophialophora bantiana CBS 173.52]